MANIDYTCKTLSSNNPQNFYKDIQSTAGAKIAVNILKTKYNFKDFK